LPLSFNLVKLLNLLVHKLLNHTQQNNIFSEDKTRSTTHNVVSTEEQDEPSNHLPLNENLPSPPYCLDDPAGQLENIQFMARGEEQRQDSSTDKENVRSEKDAETSEDEQASLSKEQSARLSRMSLKTAVAIAL
jgi:hypothetical protein